MKFVETLGLRITNLLAVKSLVTLSLLAVFIYCVLLKIETSELFNTVFVMVISFYFGTQVDKNKTTEQLPCPYASGGACQYIQTGTTTTVNTVTGTTEVVSGVPIIDESSILEDDTCV